MGVLVLGGGMCLSMASIFPVNSKVNERRGEEKRGLNRAEKGLKESWQRIRTWSDTRN